MIAARGYYGAHLGPLSQLDHGVSGDVYAVDSRTLFIKNFNYDGEGPGNLQFLSFSVCVCVFLCINLLVNGCHELTFLILEFPTCCA